MPAQEDWFVLRRDGCKIVRDLRVRLTGEETDNVAICSGRVCVGGDVRVFGG